MALNYLLDEIGRRLRQYRIRAGLSLAELADRAHLSRRYLSEAEAGRANLSVLKLAALAQSLHLPLASLCDIPLRRSFGGRVVLLGMPGAGKTAVGQQLALRLEQPFLQIEALIAERLSLSRREILNLQGPEYYAELEHDAIEQFLVGWGAAVLETDADIVERPQSLRRLLSTCLTVWLKASPEVHWHRVINREPGQRLRQNSEALAALRQVMDAREKSYSECALVLETTGRKVSDIVAEILAVVES